MSLGACIPDLLAQGKIAKGNADKAKRTYDRHFEALRGSMGDEAAAAEATTRALAELDYAAKLRKRQAGLQILAQKRLDIDMDAAVAKGTTPHRSLVKSLRRVDDLKEVIENGAHDALFDFLQRHRRNLLGSPKDKAGLHDLVDDIHGGDSGNPTAKALAKSVHDVLEQLRLRFNRAGGDIAHRADFGLSHRHDPLKVRKAGFAKWRADMLPQLAVEKMVDPLSGGAFTPQRLDEFIEASFKNISTNGLSEIGGSGGLASRALANRRSDPRFFVFKDGASWLKYAHDYGEGNAFEAIMSHIHGMARDIAFMEQMGPNPAATWRRAVDRADRVSANSSVIHTGAINGTSAGKFHAERVWLAMNGDLTVPVLAEGDGVRAKVGRGAVSALHGTRDVLTSALLGSAQLTSIADINTNVFARKFNDLPQAHVLMGYLQQLNPLDAGHRRLAIYLGAGAKDASRSLAGLSRWFGETHGPRWSQVLADGVLRVTGMNKFFEAGRGSFITDYFAQMGRERGLGYEQLPTWRRAAFERHGITPDDWEVIRAAEPHRFRGVDYVDWHRIAETDPKVADKLSGAILHEARSAVIESSAESQAVVRAGRPGTLWGELGGNTLQFKSFPVALIMSQAERVAEIDAREGATAAATYVGSFLVGMWLLGAVSLQAKEVAKGRDLRPMDNTDFWFDAFVNGGGLGPIGDLVGSLKNDVVNGLGAYLGGPFVSFVEDAVRTGESAFKTDPQTGQSDFGHQATRFLRRYTPGTTIFYLRAALDRLVWDELEQRVDPNYFEHQQRLREKEQKRGQGRWIDTGELPQRLPTMGATPAE